VNRRYLRIFCFLADIDECASDPCMNSGTCSTPDVNMYECDCAPGYTGTDCETGSPSYFRMVFSRNSFLGLWINADIDDLAMQTIPFAVVLYLTYNENRLRLMNVLATSVGDASSVNN